MLMRDWLFDKNLHGNQHSPILSGPQESQSYRWISGLEMDGVDLHFLDGVKFHLKRIKSNVHVYYRYDASHIYYISQYFLVIAFIITPTLLKPEF
ncbi:hypothetical protein EUGRSUZ_B02898 [Eucalyptus grandis]|uniref:Uncharacterized protein n=2 Tax=Eucalyptus grandis TaxID=71139 RepID=A0A059D6U1_EUCGR|nr:hypothetical protein EUGRSUZ_B02898 [Eucalyptus grandis]